MNSKLVNLLIFVALFLCAGNLKAQHLILLQQGRQTNIRGMSVVDDKIAWVSGSKGYVAITADGGKTWAWQQVKGYEKADFRSIYAISATEAIIMGSGTPALILKTNDGGITWLEKYRNIDTAYFLDAMDFADAKHGFILGDPIDNKFLLLETTDGGDQWKIYNNRPVALTGEAAFAASGTCLRVTPNGNIFIATGGKFAEMDIPKPNGGWNHHIVPVLKGRAAMGAFSIAAGKDQLVVVGGDYEHDKRSDSTACYSTNGGFKWQLAKIPPAGYQSCVEFISGATYLSTGTPGTNITSDGGKTWRKIDGTSFNVCRKARHGTLVLTAGNDGKIAIFKP